LSTGKDVRATLAPAFLPAIVAIVTLASGCTRDAAWAPLMTAADPPEHFRYGAEKIEAEKSKALPFRFHEPASGPALVSGVCFFPSGPPGAPPYWFDFTGNPLAGKPKSNIPSEYFVSSAPAARGLRLRARFGGAVSGSGEFYETAYFHEQKCDAGGMEFGFFRNVIAGQTIFYFSNNSNCGVQPQSYCHTRPEFTSPYMNSDNDPGEALTNHVGGLVLDRVNPDALLDYSIRIEPDRDAPHGYRFQVDVTDPATSKHVDCDVYDAWKNYWFKNRPCGFQVQPQSWYRIDQLYKGKGGYVTAGVQHQGEQTTQRAIDFAVEEISVPR
jgi:hypothetical protein